LYQLLLSPRKLSLLLSHHFSFISSAPYSNNFNTTIFLQEIIPKVCYNNNVTENEPIFSDDDIVRSVQEGHTHNFEILLNRYSKKIINFIHKMIFDYDESQSLAQDVFVKVYVSLKNYKAQDNFQAFVFTIAKNLTLNYIKKHKRFTWFSRFQTGNDFSEERYFQTQGTQHETLEKSQQEKMITDALKSLNENQRIALILKVYLDLPYNKIVDITGWSIPKIETLISRAKSNLKKKIIEDNLQENDRLNVLNMRST
jgi:RNA polymerase sigma-70 factor, ECF subfamily